MIKEICNHKVYQRDCYSCWHKRLPKMKSVSGKDVMDFVDSIGIKRFMIKKLWDFERERISGIVNNDKIFFDPKKIARGMMNRSCIDCYKNGKKECPYYFAAFFDSTRAVGCTEYKLVLWKRNYQGGKRLKQVKS